MTSEEAISFASEYLVDELDRESWEIEAEEKQAMAECVRTLDELLRATES